MGSVALIAALYELLSAASLLAHHVLVLLGFAVYWMRWQTGQGAFDPSLPFAIRLGGSESSRPHPCPGALWLPFTDALRFVH